jgi:hypothetical protein
MTKKLPLATVSLPQFRSDKAAAEYLETHSVAEVWDQLPEEKQARPVAALVRWIRERNAQAVKIRCSPPNGDS